MPAGLAVGAQLLSCRPPSCQLPECHPSIDPASHTPGPQMPRFGQAQIAQARTTPRRPCANHPPHARPGPWRSGSDWHEYLLPPQERHARCDPCWSKGAARSVPWTLWTCTCSSHSQQSRGPWLLGQAVRTGRRTTAVQPTAGRGNRCRKPGSSRAVPGRGSQRCTWMPASARGWGRGFCHGRVDHEFMVQQGGGMYVGA